MNAAEQIYYLSIPTTPMTSPYCSPTIKSMDGSAFSSSDEDFKLESAPLNHAKCPQPQNARPMGSSHGCVQTDMAVDEWEEFNKWKQQRGGLQATPRPIGRAFLPESQCTEHPRFFLPAMNIFFLVCAHSNYS